MHFGKRKSSTQIDNNQPFSVGRIKITVNEAEMDSTAIPRIKDERK